MEGRAQLGSGRPGSEFLRLMSTHFLDASVDLLDDMASSRYLLVGRAQAEFLLGLDTLAKMK